MSITYKLVIDYISEYGIRHKVIKTIEFLQTIPLPFTCEEDHCLIDFSKTNPYLFIEKVDCVDVNLKNIHCEAVLKTFVKLKFKVIATLKEGFMLVIAGPVKYYSFFLRFFK